jgi:transcriptional regulator with XRE-family HTH domain
MTRQDRIDLISIGESCRYYRIRNKINVADLAKEIGCSVALIYKFERGDSNNALVLIGYIKRGFTNENIV